MFVNVCMYLLIYLFCRFLNSVGICGNRTTLRPTCGQWSVGLSFCLSFRCVAISQDRVWSSYMYHPLFFSRVYLLNTTHSCAIGILVCLTIMCVSLILPFENVETEPRVMYFIISSKCLYTTLDRWSWSVTFTFLMLLSKVNVDGHLIVFAPISILSLCAYHNIIAIISILN